MTGAGLRPVGFPATLTDLQPTPNLLPTCACSLFRSRNPNPTSSQTAVAINPRLKHLRAHIRRLQSQLREAQPADEWQQGPRE